MSGPRIAFAGDRDIGVAVLKFILRQGIPPLALLVSDAGQASHSAELAALCAYLQPEQIFRGREFRQAQGLAALRALNLDYIIGVHFPYLVPPPVLELPRIGVLNLHPAYLPYNRGWHTVSWALLEGTAIGATLHFMDAGIDTGDIVHQKLLDVSPADTADSLYRRVKQLELEVFEEAWPLLVSGSYTRTAQPPNVGTTHKRDDLFRDDIQRIDLDQHIEAGDLLRRLRALTTNRVDEAAYFEINGKRYRVQVRVHEELDEC